MLDINWHPTKRELRVFFALLIAFGAFVGWWIERRFGHRELAFVLSGTLAALGVAGCVAPKRMQPLYTVWIVATYPIGWLVSHAVLAAIFFFVITPIGLLVRLLGRDSMRRRLDRAASTYWERRKSSRTARDYFRQF